MSHLIGKKNFLKKKHILNTLFYNIYILAIFLIINHIKCLSILCKGYTLSYRNNIKENKHLKIKELITGSITIKFYFLFMRCPFRWAWILRGMNYFFSRGGWLNVWEFRKVFHFFRLWQNLVCFSRSKFISDGSIFLRFPKEVALHNDNLKKKQFFIYKAMDGHRILKTELD